MVITGQIFIAKMNISALKFSLKGGKENYVTDYFPIKYD